MPLALIKFPGGKVVLISTFAILLTCGTLWLVGQGPQISEHPADDVQLVAVAGGNDKDSAPAKSDGDADPPRAAGRPRRKVTEAQRIPRLQRTVEADRKQLDELNRQGEDPEGEYREAEDEFTKLDAEFAAIRKQVQELRRANKKEDAEQIIADNAELKSHWQAARERFDLAIQQRKTLREKAAALAKKIQQDSEALSALELGDSPTPVEQPPFAAGEPAPLPTQPGGPLKTPAAEARGGNPPAPDASPPKPQAEAAALSGLDPLTRAVVAAPPATDEPAEKNSGDQETDESDHELAQARREALERRADARAAEHNVESVNERFEGLRENIALEQQLLGIAHAKADQAQAERENLDKELQRKLAEDPSGLDEVWQSIAETDQRRTEARGDIRRTEERLDQLHSELNGLQDEQLAALGKARQLDEVADAAQSRFNELRNPFTLPNLVQWFLDHGPKLMTVVAATMFLGLMVKLSGRQLARFVARTSNRGTARDRQNRALTLVGVFRNTASLAILAGGTLMTLDEAGIPIGPLLGGAAVLGLAVAFGAQNLIRDYFSGFMVLLEDQYGINDVVKIGDVSGSVEKITLRMTELRDMDGALHFIPHGSITRVTNMTHGWARAVVDVGIAYKEDADRVMRVLVEIGKQLRNDPTYGPLVLDGPEMQGVEQLGDSSVVIRFFLKTQPLQRWFVRREMLRRIKTTFDELGIEIPFPQHTIHHRYNGAQESNPNESREPSGSNRDA